MCISDLCVCVWASDLSSSTCCAFEISIVEPGQAKTAFHFYAIIRARVYYIYNAEVNHPKGKEKSDVIS
jgi:hypothetical protein